MLDVKYFNLFQFDVHTVRQYVFCEEFRFSGLNLNVTGKGKGTTFIYYLTENLKLICSARQVFSKVLNKTFPFYAKQLNSY